VCSIPILTDSDRLVDPEARTDAERYDEEDA